MPAVGPELAPRTQCVPGWPIAPITLRSSARPCITPKGRTHRALGKPGAARSADSLTFALGQGVPGHSEASPEARKIPSS